MQRTRVPSIVAVIALLWLSLAAGAAEPGWFGFAISADVEGLMTPTLRSITVGKVFPDSPAAAAGLAPGDSVVEVQGIVVAGARADVLKAAMQKSPGETLHLKVRHGAEVIREVSMIAVKKPQ